MVTIHCQDYKLFVDSVVVADLEKRSEQYPVFVYRSSEDNSFQILYQFEDLSEPWVFLGSITVEAESSAVLEKRKKEVIQHLYNKVDSIHAELISNYSVLEKESWLQQEEEARALLSVSTPTLSALCAVRGCSRDELALKILENAERAKAVGISILAWQQGLEKVIKTMKIEDFETIWQAINDKNI